MRIYKVLICAIILFAVANNVLNAQSLRLVRTDVDSTRSNFVTATYLFGFDVYIDKIDSCTAVSFDLDYTNSNYISFSEVISTPFGYGGKGPVIISRKNSLDNTGYVYVGVLSGDEVGARGYDNPKVVHLEFAVGQDALHGLNTEFSFSNVQAVISSGNSGRIIPVAADPVTYSIHSFINVWPGDADNNDTVNSKDVTTIGRFIGYGSSSKTSMRSFKRMNASTIWAPQSVLAWDSIEVARADCDGNGDVTVMDQLIVTLNFGKTHPTTNSKILPFKKSTELLAEEPVSPTVPITANTKRKKILLNSNYSFLGAAGKLSWYITDPNTKVIGFEKTKLFNDEDAELFYKISDNSADISMLNLDKTVRNEVRSGEFCTMLIDGDADAVNIIGEEVYAISQKYGFFKVQATCDVVQNGVNDNRIISFTAGNQRFIKNTANCDTEYMIYDLLGQLIKSAVIHSGEIINIDNTAANASVFVVYKLDADIKLLKL